MQNGIKHRDAIHYIYAVKEIERQFILSVQEELPNHQITKPSNEPMSLLALIGYPVSHSFSKKYFEEKFSQLGLPNWRYELWPLENLNGLLELIDQHKDLVGFNVTIPHKIDILPFCHKLSDEAAAIGAVNCVKINRKGVKPELIGYNTDAFGFEESLKGWVNSTVKKAIIYGDGGSAKAIKYVLQKRGIEFIQVVRNVKNKDHIQWQTMTPEIFSQYDLIINCTPVGMFPDIEEQLNIESQWIQPGQYFYDLVYNPTETATMQLFANRGANVKNGLEMLHLQADKAWEIWNGSNDVSKG